MQMHLTSMFREQARILVEASLKYPFYSKNLLTRNFFKFNINMRIENAKKTLLGHCRISVIN
jgi:hypothetical protein